MSFKKLAKDAQALVRSTEDKNVSMNNDRFQGNGVKFKCKFVGTADVVGERGDDICFEAIKNVKEQAKERKQKQKIDFQMSLNGIRIVDETTQEVQHEHPINKISYITPYPDDKNIFGYIYSPSHAEYRIFVVKSKEPAEVLTETMNELFQVKSQLKQKGEASSREVRRRSLVDSAGVIKAVGESSQTDASAFIQQQRQMLNEVRLSREKDQQVGNSQRQQSEMEQRMKRMEEQLREKDRALENWTRLSRERQQQSTNFQRQLREKELQEASLHAQLREKCQQEQNQQKQLRELQQPLKEKDDQEKNLQRQLREMEQQLRKKDEQGKNLQRQLREMEQQLRKKNEQEENLQDRLRVMTQRLREGEDQKENLQRQFREMEQQLTNLQGQFRDKQDETANLQEQVTTLEQQLRVKDQQVNELEITLSTAQRQALNEHQRRQVTPEWVISHDQIQLTDKLLGRGGWGSVVEGKYCGCSVAVKQIHELILSPHNRALFEREMNIASRCRHPCLLQFIGATNDEGRPLFVTELMESSLRALLEERPLATTEVSIISLDVARALNYLHQKKPSPIIHRDISSANVLLWRQGDQWRSKVSDYGTANVMQQTMTVGPGAMIYMAPEAHTSKQTVKVDVYSFGVLLCEMCIRELPDPARCDQQIAMVTNSQLRALIRGCVQREPAARPNMEEIIERLEPVK